MFGKLFDLEGNIKSIKLILIILGYGLIYFSVFRLFREEIDNIFVLKITSGILSIIILFAIFYLLNLLSGLVDNDSQDAIAANIASSILNTIGSSFLIQRQELNDYKKWVDENNQFIPPDGFWEDEYVIGFISCLAWLILKSEFNSNLYPDRHMQVISRVVQIVCQGKSEQVMKIILSNTEEDKIQSPIFSQGVSHAINLNLMARGLLGALKNDDPLIIQAKEFASKFSKDDEFNYNMRLAISYKKHTLDKYITEKFSLKTERSLSE